MCQTAGFESFLESESSGFVGMRLSEGGQGSFWDEIAGGLVFGFLWVRSRVEGALRG